MNIEQMVRNLRNEVDCRIAHGAGGEHMKYVHGKLNEMLREIEPEIPLFVYKDQQDKFDKIINDIYNRLDYLEGQGA
jgi:hypothetical protein